MKSRKPEFSWPPPGDEKKQFHAEVAAPAVILQSLGVGIKISPPATKDEKGRAIKPKYRSLEEWLADQSCDMGGLIAGGARSWNHPQLLMAARGLALGDWGDAGKLMGMQAGRIPGEGAAQWLDGEEPRSTDYDPYRWAAELIFLLKGPRPMQFRADVQEVLRRQGALASLGAVPWTDLSGDLSNARGELWHRGATLSPVGERSPKTSNPDMLGLFERFTEGSGGNDREGFAGAVADIVGFPTLGLPTVKQAVEILADVPVFGVFHFTMYPEGLLVWRPEQINPNTPSALWSWADHATQRQIRGYPYPADSKNRGKAAARSLGCGIENGEIVMRTTFDVAKHRLPTSQPLWDVVVDQKGARFV